MTDDDHYCDSKPADPSSALVNTIVSSIGTAIGISLNISPALLFYQVCTKKRLYIDIPESFLVSNIICNIINLAYGFQLRDIMISISSGVGTSFAVLWGIIFLSYLSKGDIKLLLLYAFILINLSAEMLYIFGYMIPNTKDTLCLGNHVAGGTAMVLTVINASTPGQNIYRVIKTGNYNLIPILTTVLIFFCNGCWFVYGLFINQLEMYVPNGLGVLLTSLQIGVFIVYYLKNKGKVFPVEEEEEPTKETKKIKEDSKEKLVESNNSIENN